jgi:hypothetical protein
MTPLNQKDILEAARVSGKVIPVHIYLYSHYEEPFGYNFTTSKQLTDLVSSLDPKRVRVVGESLVALSGLAAAPFLDSFQRWNPRLAPAAAVVLSHCFANFKGGTSEGGATMKSHLGSK